ncbi:MAG: hypothetical protein Q9226_007350 [Calogaya cf. arnoldii]
MGAERQTGGTDRPANKDIDGAANNFNVRGTPESGVQSWTAIGQIANYAAESACQGNGEYGLSSAIGAHAEKACKQLVDMVPGAPLASSAWNVWQAAKPSANGEREQFRTMFRFFYKSDDAPKLNEVICKEAIE